jgi:hypothetical protein
MDTKNPWKKYGKGLTMAKYGKKAQAVNAHYKLRLGEPKTNNKSTKISKHKKGYKKRR